jgi:asparagine synthase (glutamine-hydrolysing)
LSILKRIKLFQGLGTIKHNTTADIDSRLNCILLNGPALKGLDFLKAADAIALVQGHFFSIVRDSCWSKKYLNAIESENLGKMCGIWACFGKSMEVSAIQHFLKNISARGPEGANAVECYGGTAQLGFTRLAINGLRPEGMQPMSFDGGRYQWICNGEIYNWKELATRHGIYVQSGSDCEVLGALFAKLATTTDARTFFRSLDGVFSMILVDTVEQMAYVARDPYGVRPLFVGYVLGEKAEFSKDRATVFDASGNRVAIERILFSSELKGLPGSDCFHVEAFPPGHYAAYDLKTLNRVGFEPYHTVPWLKNPGLAEEDSAAGAIRVALEVAVKKRMMMERPVAALLSGGLDSSLIAALVQKNLKEAGAVPLKTFSIGFEGSEDLRHARLVAGHIGSDHTEILMTPEAFLEAIPIVIRDIESFDITTVRASVGNWLVSREIRRRTDCKVVFNGDGSDEVFGGYMYFYKAPSDEAFEAESRRLLEDIHLFDVLRSDRSISSHGLEPRTPFLDKQFVAVSTSVATALRRPLVGSQPEKYILRKAFEGTGLLPDAVLWRKKEAFSDGVSGLQKSWYQICKEHALNEVGDEWASKAAVFRHLMPASAEAYYYRSLFDRYYRFAERAIVPYHWMPRWTPGATDPSARTLEVYKTVA